MIACLGQFLLYGLTHDPPASAPKCYDYPCAPLCTTVPSYVISFYRGAIHSPSHVSVVPEASQICTTPTLAQSCPLSPQERLVTL